MIDVEDTMLNIVHELGRLLLGDEYFDGYLASNEGNEIGDIVRL